MLPMAVHGITWPHAATALLYVLDVACCDFTREAIAWPGVLACRDGLIAAGPLTTQTETFWFSDVPGAMQITAQPFSTVAPYG